MNTLISTFAIVALTTVALAGAASAAPGNGNVPKPGNQQGPQINLNGLLGGGAGGGQGGQSYGGGDTTSPGDAFYPDVSVGDPRSECDALGGQSVRRYLDGDFAWICVR